jgi:hypothetical protein
MCLKARLPPNRCERAGAYPAQKVARKHQAVSWLDLFDADPHFAHAAYAMALRYGYCAAPP